MYLSYGPQPEVPRPQVLAPHPIAPVMPPPFEPQPSVPMMPAPFNPGPQPVSPRIPAPEVSPEVPTLSPRQPLVPSPEPPEPADPSPQPLDFLGKGAGKGVDEPYETFQPEESIQHAHQVRKTKIAEVLAERRMRREADSRVSQTSGTQIVEVSVQTTSVMKSCKVEVHIHGLEALPLYGVPEQAIGA